MCVLKQNIIPNLIWKVKCVEVLKRLKYSDFTAAKLSKGPFTKDVRQNVRFFHPPSSPCPSFSEFGDPPPPLDIKHALKIHAILDLLLL